MVTRKGLISGTKKKASSKL